MVMIMFKAEAQTTDNIELTSGADAEEMGRALLRAYTNKQEDICLNAEELDDDIICQIALGAELEDYRFDKYAKLSPQGT